MRNIASWVTVLVLTGPGCLFVDGSFHENGLNSFSLAVSDNPGLRIDHVGVVDQQTKTITVTVPDYIDATRVVPRFSMDGVEVTVAGVPQTSGKSEVDLSGPVTYEARGKDDRVLRYSVQPLIVPASSVKELLSLTFTPQYDEQYATVWKPSTSDTVLKVALDWTRHSYFFGPNDLTRFFFVVKHTGIRIEMDGQPISNQEVYDLTQDHTLTMTAEDLSTRTFQLQVDWDLRFSFVTGSRSYSAFEDGQTILIPRSQQIGLNGIWVTFYAWCPYPLTKSNGTTVSYGTGAVLDLTTPVTFRLTNARGESESYTLVLEP